MKIGSLVQLETVTGEPREVAGLVVRMQSQSFSLQLPFGAWLYNRPVAIVVGEGEESERVPIVDVTRVAQLSLLGGAALFSILGLAAGARARAQAQE